MIKTPTSTLALFAVVPLTLYMLFTINSDGGLQLSEPDESIGLHQSAIDAAFLEHEQASQRKPTDPKQPITRVVTLGKVTRNGHMATESHFAGHAENSASGGASAWSSTIDAPSSMSAEDENWMTCSLDNNAASQTIVANTFGFAIPTGAIINGIEVSWRRMENNSGGIHIFDNNIDVSSPSVGATGGRADAAEWADAFSAQSYGGPTDLWGASWTAEDINDPLFGSSLSCRDVGGSLGTAQVDACVITVYYDEAAPVDPVELRAGSQTMSGCFSQP
jgi:hypothetical protein